MTEKNICKFNQNKNGNTVTYFIKLTIFINNLRIEKVEKKYKKRFVAQLVRN